MIETFKINLLLYVIVQIVDIISSNKDLAYYSKYYYSFLIIIIFLKNNQ